MTYGLFVRKWSSPHTNTQTHQTDRYTWPLKRSVSANITNEELRIFIFVQTYRSRTVKRRGSGNSPVRHTDLASTIDHIPSLWCPRQHGDRPPVSEWWPCRSLKGGARHRALEMSRSDEKRFGSIRYEVTQAETVKLLHKTFVIAVQRRWQIKAINFFKHKKTSASK